MTKPIADPRLTAARPDLAAASLRGLVDAPRYAEGQHGQVLVELLDCKRRPRPDAPVDTQLLYGETVVVYEDDAEGWSWIQAERDGYVGYVASSALGRVPWTATHRVIVNRTFIYPGPDMKLPVLGAVPLDGRVAALGTTGIFTKLHGGYVITAHLADVARPADDFVAVAEQLVGAPYLWGGKSVGGIDCSGLVQVAMSLANRSMPRDTDLQQRSDEAMSLDPAAGLQRGDLVFWSGHVGIMSDSETLLHANGHHMLVIREPLAAAQDRILAATRQAISAIRRPRIII